MTKNTALTPLILLVLLLAVVVSAAGLFWPQNGAPFNFTNIHGEEIRMYGQGLYRNDAFFNAPIYRGTDAVTLFLYVPLLIIALLLYRHSGLRGELFLAGVLSYLLYFSTSRAIGTAYNPIFLVYIAFFSACLYAFIATVCSISLVELQQAVSPRFPNRRAGIFLFVAGLSVFVWLIELVGGLLTGTVPASVGANTTDVTAVLDVGIIAPAAYTAGALLLRRAPLGYLLGFVMTFLNAMVGVMVIGQTVFQMAVGIVLNMQQTIAYVTPFILLTPFAVWILTSYWKNIRPSGSASSAG